MTLDWGAINGEAITSDFASNSLTVGTAGSGKTVGVVQPTILTTPGSKLMTDFKSENTAVLKRALEERGEEVRVINLSDINADIISASDSYNPLELIAGNFFGGSLLDVSDDVLEMVKQLYPDPPSDGGDNKFFRDGSRDLMSFAIQASILIDGHSATLGDVAALMNDRERFLNHALWACGKLPVGGNAQSYGRARVGHAERATS